jgi:flagella basal body P-ring formation protein FlgA
VSLKKKIKDFQTEEDQDIQQNLSFIESKKQRASARKLSHSNLLSDHARRLSARALSVCSAKQEQDMKRSADILESYVSHKQKIEKGIKTTESLRQYRKIDNQELAERRDAEKALRLRVFSEQFRQRN